VAKTSDRREFVILADKYAEKLRQTIVGWLYSEKMDGTRCFWDGGVSRGRKTVDVPWANIYDPKKPGEYKKKIKPVASGLWSRYGNPIMAPDWFLDRLPKIFLDGELWAGRGKFQLNRSIVAGDKPDPRFDQIEYRVYGAPRMDSIFRSGEIKIPKLFTRRIELEACVNYCSKHGKGLQLFHGQTFQEELDWLHSFPYASFNGNLIWKVHEQKWIEEGTDLAQIMDELVAKGAEGMVIRNPKATYTPKRVKDLLKYKPFEDDEGTLVGYFTGEETDKGSRNLGKIGSLILDYKGKRLKVSGLNDDERELNSAAAIEWAKANPGKDLPETLTNAKHFKIGQVITFRYRELSDDKIPKEARYDRVRAESLEDAA
jgi:DNA ligase-1